jgi:hypothetical protein
VLVHVFFLVDFPFQQSNTPLSFCGRDHPILYLPPILFLVGGGNFVTVGVCFLFCVLFHHDCDEHTQHQQYGRNDKRPGKRNGTEQNFGLRRNVVIIIARKYHTTFKTNERV